VLSRPSILARNNQEAVIVVGSEVPFVTNSRITENGETINTVTYDNVGIILKVTPFITSEGSVEMIVAPEISALTDQTVPISNNASAPVISKRSAETVVVTPNRTTVVIGGLMETQRTNTIQKVPILGDIPGLGLAFRHKISNDTKRELLIFLTPEIINNTPGLKAATEGEAARTELVKDAFKNGELNRYIDNPLFDEHIPPVESAKEITVTESRPRTTQIHIHKADPLEVKPERKPVDMRDPTPAPVRPGPSTPPSAADAPTPQNSKPIRVRRFEPSKPESTPATQQAPDESR
jgi:Flp pilus assembly secretin CpaC